MSDGIDYSKWNNLDISSSSDEEQEQGSPRPRDESNQFKDDYKCEEMPDGWLKVGHVLIHPEQISEFASIYSPTILREDPNTFVPDPSNFVDGCVTKWGLLDLPCLEDNPGLFAAHIAITSSSNLCYKDVDNPTVQFIKVLEERKLAFAASELVEASLGSAFVIKISLCENEEDVWRRVQVPAAIDLSKLHDQVIVPCMGWARGYHGYAFEDPKDGAVLGPNKYAGYIDMMHVPYHYHYIMDDSRLPLASVLREEGDFVFYTYDLGDSWKHKIELEQVVETDASQVLLLDGAGACPPEDSNGLEGKGNSSYAMFLRAYKKSPKKLAMKEAVREVEKHGTNYSKPWLGGPPIKFKPLEFNIQYHRKLLEGMVAGPSVRKRGGFGSVDSDQFKESMRGCAACGDRLKALSKCSKCQKVFYCSRDCQVSHWKTGGHKEKCKKLRASKKEG